MAIQPISIEIIDRDDVREALSGLQDWYATRDLYERYCERAKVNGHDPVSINRFGRALTSLGYVKQTVRGVVCRLVMSTDEPVM